VLLTFDSEGTAYALSAPTFSASDACLGFETDSFGLASSYYDRQNAVKASQKLADEYDLPLVIVHACPTFPWADLTVRAPVSWALSVFKRSRLTRPRFAEKHLSAPPHLAENVAEALCLRVWAERAPEVHALLKRARQQKAA
jgi:hypothetical protein